MKKDDKLESAFDEYFEGLEKPEGLTEDAKQLNKKRKPLWANLKKYASAISCALIVCVVAAVGIYSSVNGGLSADAPDSDNVSDSTPGGTAYYDTYSLSALESAELDAYSLTETNSALWYIEKFSLAENASVDSCTGYSDENGLILVKADVTVATEYNQQTAIYVEFTEDGFICDELTEFYEGSTRYYYGVTYLFFETISDDGEPVKCVKVELDGVKYYIRVTSTDETAYLNYLELLLY